VGRRDNPSSPCAGYATLRTAPVVAARSRSLRHRRLFLPPCSATLTSSLLRTGQSSFHIAQSYLPRLRLLQHHYVRPSLSGVLTSLSFTVRCSAPFTIGPAVHCFTPVSGLFRSLRSRTTHLTCLRIALVPLALRAHSHYRSPCHRSASLCHHCSTPSLLRQPFANQLAQWLLTRYATFSRRSLDFTPLSLILPLIISARLSRYHLPRPLA